MSYQAAEVKSLTKFISDEVYKAFGLSPSGWYRKLLQPLVQLPARRFARLGVIFDDWVSRFGLTEAARRILPRFINSYSARGMEHIPCEGPLIIASNHPGTYDGLVIAAELPRSDLRIVAGDIAFIGGLPSTSRQVLFATRNTHDRIAILRAALRHLQQGGSLLIFPSGRIDPDPDVLPGAEQALQDWSGSIELLLRRVPHSRLIPTIVSGVMAHSCAYNPLVHLRRQPLDRRRLAQFIQVIQQMVFDRKYALNPRVTFGEPGTFEFFHKASPASSVLDAIIVRARQMMQQHLFPCMAVGQS